MHTVYSGLWSKCTCKRSDYEMNKNYSTVSLQSYLNESKRVCAYACACVYLSTGVSEREKKRDTDLDGLIEVPLVSLLHIS